MIQDILTKTAEHFGMKEFGFYSDDNVDLFCDDDSSIRIYDSDTDLTDMYGMFGIGHDNRCFVIMVYDLRALKYVRYMSEVFEELTLSELTKKEEL